jgi:hypothetical protein
MVAYEYKYNTLQLQYVYSRLAAVPLFRITQ